MRNARNRITRRLEESGLTVEELFYVRAHVPISFLWTGTPMNPMNVLFIEKNMCLFIGVCLCVCVLCVLLACCAGAFCVFWVGCVLCKQPVYVQKLCTYFVHYLQCTGNHRYTRVHTQVLIGTHVYTHKYS